MRDRSGHGRRPRQGRYLVRALLIGCVLLTLGAVGWAAVAYATHDADSRPTQQKSAERQAGLAPDQHPNIGRYYIPGYARIQNGTALLRYTIEGAGDSTVADFLRTYEIGGRPRTTGPTEITYTDRVDGARRTVVIAYDDPDTDPTKEDIPARITVTAGPPGGA
ncbi:hypothetical protein [Streptomyces milbemycinicus]|uniref:Secreted protein n=1 Tax=Streptomyces milbemycinicus TaxID=476552 RepID=A0ABW8LKK7_9ACTN